MTYNRALAVFLIALISAASNPLAHGQTITPRGLTVGGRLCCTSTGNCPGQGVSGALVSLNCTIFSVNATVGQNTTNANGTFNITIPALTGLILGLPNPPCVAIVRLPLNSVVCPVLSTVNATLVSTVRTLGTIVTSTLGLIQNATITGFVTVRL